MSSSKFYKNNNRTKRIKNTQFERKAVMIHMAMVKDVMFGKTMRKSYAKYEEILEIPNMLKIQKDSYEWFLETGLRQVFKDVGTIICKEDLRRLFCRIIHHANINRKSVVQV